jgi:YidC/Oxa1 family membrane protein insertase
VLSVLAKTKPGHKLAIDIMRGGSGESAERKSLQATLGQRPLEVVRPEFRTLPVVDPDADPCDPLSFLLSLESRAAAKRAEPLTEIEGQHLRDRDWEIDAADASRVRFTRQLPGGLSIAKEYRLVCGPGAADADGRAAGSPPCRLELRLELLATEKPEAIVYALDGPTGLPTEGWWYAARIARDWGTLAVRDVAVRFAGEASTLISGLKMADGSLEHPASAVREGKPLSFAGVDALYFASALVPAVAGPEAPAG